MEQSSKILLVDDDTDLLRLLSLRLSAEGYTVAGAESGPAALAQFAAERPDLLITDLRMEGMDGLAVYDAVREASPTLPVIILTAHGSIPDAVEATRRGVFQFLTKPFDSRELIAEIERALHSAGARAEGTTVQDAEQWRRPIVTRSARMEELLRKARLAADSPASILICGESGTGKELLARAVHDASPRAAEQFVAVNCGAIPEPLLESELFGHVKGSFTGAHEQREGLFVAADGGTVFLDEIGDMPLSLQVKLLRVLQDGEVRPVGSSSARTVDLRVLSATHRNLEQAIAEGTFREDLYYRLNVVRLDLPSLEERREDIPLLAEHLLGQLRQRGSKRVQGFSPAALEALVAAQWPGNIRQLRNVIEQAYTLSTGAVVSADLVRDALRSTPDGILPMSEARRRFELDYLVGVLKMAQGNVTQAARLAGRNRTDFYKLLRRHHLDPSRFKQQEATA